MGRRSGGGQRADGIHHPDGPGPAVAEHGHGDHDAGDHDDGHHPGPPGRRGRGDHQDDGHVHDHDAGPADAGLPANRRHHPGADSPADADHRHVGLGSSRTTSPRPTRTPRPRTFARRTSAPRASVTEPGTRCSAPMGSGRRRAASRRPAAETAAPPDPTSGPAAGLASASGTTIAYGRGVSPMAGIRPMQPGDLDRVDEIHAAAFELAGALGSPFFRGRVEPRWPPTQAAPSSRPALVGGSRASPWPPGATDSGGSRCWPSTRGPGARTGCAPARAGAELRRGRRRPDGAGLPRPPGPAPLRPGRVHPPATVAARGVVGRRRLPLTRRPREGGTDDVDLCTLVDRQVRGSARPVDLVFLMQRGARLWLIDDGGGRGYALGSPTGWPRCARPTGRRRQRSWPGCSPTPGAASSRSAG